MKAGSLLEVLIGERALAVDEREAAEMEADYIEKVSAQMHPEDASLFRSAYDRGDQAALRDVVRTYGCGYDTRGFWSVVRPWRMSHRRRRGDAPA